MAISGGSASGGAESRQTPQGYTCVVAISRNLALEERDGTVTFTQTDTYSLVDDPESCADFEAVAKAVSNNDLGYQGCVVVKRQSGPRL
jgi:hypothetical protein